MSLKTWLAERFIRKELETPVGLKVVDWFKRNKKLVGTVVGLGYVYLLQHPELDMARELLGILSGALVGAGAMDSDQLARAKQGNLT